MNPNFKPDDGGREKAGFKGKAGDCVVRAIAIATKSNYDELPKDKTIIVSLSKHIAAVVNGVLHDLSDCSRNGTRCVYGYWEKEE